jgi:hypothetical protein
MSLYLFETVLVISLSLVSSQTNKFFDEGHSGSAMRQARFFVSILVMTWQDGGLAALDDKHYRSFANYLRNVIFL